jgi:RNA recognition motif-containing protein
MNIFVGNLAAEVTEEDLKSLFSEYGNITSVKVIKDMFSGTSRGFGFVEMPGQAQAQKAISELNTQELKGKKITVNEARPRGEKGANRGGSRGGSGGGFNKGAAKNGGRRSW